VPSTLNIPTVSSDRFPHASLPRSDLVSPNGGKILIQERAKISAKATAIGAVAVITATAGAFTLANSALAAAAYRKPPRPVVPSHARPAIIAQTLAAATPTESRRVAPTKVSSATSAGPAAAVTSSAASPSSRATANTATPTETVTTGGNDPYTAVAGSRSLHKTFTGTSTDLQTAERKALKACERQSARTTRDGSSRKHELRSKQSDCTGYAWISVKLETGTVTENRW